MKQDRREFLKKTGCTLTMTALATQMGHFGLMSAIAQETKDKAEALVPSDYRALVCIFLSGGNDANNTVIPNHNDGTISNYTAYSNARSGQGLAIAAGRPGWHIDHSSADGQPGVWFASRSGRSASGQ